MTLRVLVTCRQMQGAFDHFRSAFAARDVDVLLPPLHGQQMHAEELEPIIGQFDGVIAGDDFFTRAVLERATRLRVISKWGVGLDAIDRVAADELGIAVVNTPNMFDDEVADVTICYLIMLARGLHRIDAAVRAGNWLKLEGRSLAGCTLGIVGLGGIGVATATRALAMRMAVIGCDPSAPAAVAARALGVEVVSFEHLLRSSDAIALNCPLTEQTRGLLGREAFAQTRHGVLVVNTARGPIIDEEALLDSLRSGQVGGVALDVFEREPLTTGNPLVSFEQVILGSHNASNTHAAVLRTSAKAVENLFSRLEAAQ